MNYRFYEIYIKGYSYFKIYMYFLNKNIKELTHHYIQYKINSEIVLMDINVWSFVWIPNGMIASPVECAFRQFTGVTFGGISLIATEQITDEHIRTPNTRKCVLLFIGIYLPKHLNER